MRCHLLALVATLSVANAFVDYETIEPVPATEEQCIGGYFPFDGNQCKYYQCEATNDGFQAYERWCMKPLNFDPETCSCQWPNNIDGGGDYACHEDPDDAPDISTLEECDMRGVFDKCCQPCISYPSKDDPGDCTQGFGPPYTIWANFSGYTYCGEDFFCPNDGVFDRQTCTCISEPWYVDCYFFPFWPETPLEDETNSGIISNGECTIRPNDRSGIECSGEGEPAHLDMLQKQWLGRGWGIGFAVDNAADGVLVSNGNDDVPSSIEFKKEGDNVIATLTADQGTVSLSVPYIMDGGAKRYFLWMDNDGYIIFQNQDLDEEITSPPFTWALDGTRLPLQFGQTAGFFTDIVVCYYPPSGQGAVDWVFGGPAPGVPTSYENKK
ncbi:unnamed protein product [Owenia fusiformis]|uniref:Uncharacterized protein n=1 Tax=Owenia fusiformis TaxID=6347 RepID=A0A8J1XP89_OWEFU|nr:unnamed protein product [Owenia fusiformis]